MFVTQRFGGFTASAAGFRDKKTKDKETGEGLGRSGSFDFGTLVREFNELA